jgi:hypothetical protein
MTRRIVADEFDQGVARPSAMGRGHVVVDQSLYSLLCGAG